MQLKQMKLQLLMIRLLIMALKIRQLNKLILLQQEILLLMFNMVKIVNLMLYPRVIIKIQTTQTVTVNTAMTKVNCLLRNHFVYNNRATTIYTITIKLLIINNLEANNNIRVKIILAHLVNQTMVVADVLHIVHQQVITVATVPHLIVANTIMEWMVPLVDSVTMVPSADTDVHLTVDMADLEVLNTVVLVVTVLLFMADMVTLEATVDTDVHLTVDMVDLDAHLFVVTAGTDVHHMEVTVATAALHMVDLDAVHQSCVLTTMMTVIVDLVVIVTIDMTKNFQANNQALHQAQLAQAQSIQ
jgi:hypothetical protein